MMVCGAGHAPDTDASQAERYQRSCDAAEAEDVDGHPASSGLCAL